MRSSRIIACTLALILLVPLTVSAQTPQMISLQFSGLASAPFGGELNNVNPGAGWEAQIRINPSLLSIGVGVEQTFHTWVDQPIDVTMIGGFIEPRLVIPLSSETAAPYLSARASISSLEFAQTTGLPTTADANGLTLNGGGGILFVLSNRVNLDVGATVGFKDLGNAEFPSTTWDLGTGANVIGRVGLAIGLGG